MHLDDPMLQDDRKSDSKVIQNLFRGEELRKIIKENGAGMIGFELVYESDQKMISS